MKVSIIHAERRCAQPLAIDVVSEFRRLASEPPAPDRLLPTERYEFALPLQQLWALVASAPLKQHGPAPLVVELEAEEGETLHADTLRVFVLEPAPPGCYTEAALDEGKLVRVAAPLTFAGDRQQYGIATVEISPARDVLVAIVNRDLVVPGCTA